MERKVLFVHSGSGSGFSLQQSVDLAIRDLGRGWEIISATSSVATCQNHSQHIHTEWVTTIVLEKK
jgi:hypothetical protein